MQGHRKHRLSAAAIGVLVASVMSVAATESLVAQGPGGAPASGCSPEAWASPAAQQAWPAQYSPNTPFSEVFSDAFPGKTLLDVLRQRGPDKNELGRQAVAALLNAASDKVESNATPDQVIATFNQAANSDNPGAAAQKLAELNRGQCPLGG